jgi:hypothetical protein
VSFLSRSARLGWASYTGWAAGLADDAADIHWKPGWLFHGATKCLSATSIGLHHFRTSKGQCKAVRVEVWSLRSVESYLERHLLTGPRTSSAFNRHHAGSGGPQFSQSHSQIDRKHEDADSFGANVRNCGTNDIKI